MFLQWAWIEFLCWNSIAEKAPFTNTLNPSKRWFCISSKFAHFMIWFMQVFARKLESRRTPAPIVNRTGDCYVIQSIKAIIDLSGWHTTTCQIQPLYITPSLIGHCKLWHMSIYIKQRVLMNINTCYYFRIFKLCLHNGPRDKSFTGMPFVFDKKP